MEPTLALDCYYVLFEPNSIQKKKDDIDEIITTAVNHGYLIRLEKIDVITSD
jgi:hypothetical protein